MRVTARMTRNTSISLGPVGWLIVEPFILAVWASAILAVVAGWLAWQDS